MRGIHREIEEDAMVDGCTPLQIFLKVALPLSLPGLATNAILCFMLSWNEFLMVMVLTAANAEILPLET